MAIPEITFTIKDGALGLIPASAANTSVSLGICEKGTADTLYAFSDVETLVDTLGQGPLTEAVALKLRVGGGSIQYAMPIDPLRDGASSAVTQTGSGSGTVAISFAPTEAITIEITTAGLPGVAKFTYAIGDGIAQGPVTIPADGEYEVPGTLTTLTFDGGAYYGSSFADGDTFTIATTGTITSGGSNTGAGWVTAQSSQPLDYYQIRVWITTAGAGGTGKFRWSLDGGNFDSDGVSLDEDGLESQGSYEAAITIPDGTGKYAIADSGIVLTFTGTFTANNIYSSRTIPSGFNTTALNNAFSELFDDSRTWGFVHVVGGGSSASGAATLASTVDSQMETAEGEYRFVFGIVECPSSLGGGSVILSGGLPIHDTADTDSVNIAAFDDFESRRTSVCAGDFQCVSQVSGRFYRRNGAWIYAARGCLIPVGEDFARFARGRLPFVKKLFRDERASEGLDAERFTTLRTYTGEPGFFITNGRTMAPVGSDFKLTQHRRVMDRACQLARARELRYLSEGVRVNSTTGYILEKDAQVIERDIEAAIRDGIVSPGQASSVSVTLSRTTNIISTESEPVTIRITPLGYLKQIETSIGFENPALNQAA